MKNILKSILLCATGASIAMGTEQADQYISNRLKATIQRVNKNTYASKKDIIEGTETLFSKFKESKKIYRNVEDRVDDALDKALFNKADFSTLDQTSKKHQLSVAYITTFASIKSQNPDVKADEVFEHYAQFLLETHAVDLKALNILQSGNIQKILNQIPLDLEPIPSSKSKIEANSSFTDGSFLDRYSGFFGQNPSQKPRTSLKKSKKPIGPTTTSFN